MSIPPHNHNPPPTSSHSSYSYQDSISSQWFCSQCFKTISSSRPPVFNAENCCCVDLSCDGGGGGGGDDTPASSTSSGATDLVGEEGAYGYGIGYGHTEEVRVVGCGEGDGNEVGGMGSYSSSVPRSFQELGVHGEGGLGLGLGMDVDMDLDEEEGEYTYLPFTPEAASHEHQHHQRATNNLHPRLSFQMRRFLGYPSRSSSSRSSSSSSSPPSNFFPHDPQLKFYPGFNPDFDYDYDFTSSPIPSPESEYKHSHVTEKKPTQKQKRSGKTHRRNKRSNLLSLDSAHWGNGTVSGSGSGCGDVLIRPSEEELCWGSGWGAEMLEIEMGTETGIGRREMMRDVGEIGAWIEVDVEGLGHGDEVGGEDIEVEERRRGRGLERGREREREIGTEMMYGGVEMQRDRGCACGWGNWYGYGYGYANTDAYPLAVSEFSEGGFEGS